MDKAIEDMDFTVRTYSVLKRNGIDTVEQIKRMDYEKITSLKNINRRSVEEIEEKLGIYFE